MRGRKAYHLEEEANTQLFVHEMTDMFCKAHRGGIASFSFPSSFSAPKKRYRVGKQNHSLKRTLVVFRPQPFSFIVLLIPGVSVYTVQEFLEHILKHMCPKCCKFKTHFSF